MNNPEYILLDELGTKDANGVLTAGILYQVKQSLGIPVLNYQYGDLYELNETLQQWAASPDDDFSGKRFPLVWLKQPYSILRGDKGIYGRLADGVILIINSTNKDWKAKEREDNNFKPVLRPIYGELMNQIVVSPVFDEPLVESIPHVVSDVYFWDEQKQYFFNDAVDYLCISGLRLRISHNQNCSPISNF